MPKTRWREWFSWSWGCRWREHSIRRNVVGTGPRACPDGGQPQGVVPTEFRYPPPFPVGADPLHPQGFRGLSLVLGTHPEDGAVALPARGDGRDGGDVDAGIGELAENRQ